MFTLYISSVLLWSIDSN